MDNSQELVLEMLCLLGSRLSRLLFLGGASSQPHAQPRWSRGHMAYNSMAAWTGPLKHADLHKFANMRTRSMQSSISVIEAVKVQMFAPLTVP